MRSHEDVRKKWQNYASICKKKLVYWRKEQKRTGGGKSDAEGLTPLELIVVEVANFCLRALQRLLNQFDIDFNINFITIKPVTALIKLSLTKKNNFKILVGNP